MPLSVCPRDGRTASGRRLHNGGAPGPATAHLGRRYLRETPMTDRVREFLRTTRPEGPCLVVDLEEVRRNYLAFERALPDSRIFYAVKANPAPEILAGLAALGSCFDCASIPEIEAALAAGATPERSEEHTSELQSLMRT